MNQDAEKRLRILHQICMEKKNITLILEKINETIKLSEEAIPKCVAHIRDILTSLVKKVTKIPRTNEEYIYIINDLNRRCRDIIIEHLSKKYPERFINRRNHPQKEHLTREIDAMGNRSNHYRDRPHQLARKNADGDYDMYKNHPDVNNVGLEAMSGASPYASAFGDHMITNVRPGAEGGDPREFINNRHEREHPNQMGRSNQYNDEYQQRPQWESDNYKTAGRRGDPSSAQQNQDALASRLSAYQTQRNSDMGRPQKPPTPNFSDNMTDEEFRQKRQREKMERSSDMGFDGMGQMGGMMGFEGMGQMGQMGNFGNFGGMDQMGQMNMGQMNMGQMNMGQMNMGQMNMGQMNIGQMGPNQSQSQSDPFGDDFYSSLLGGGAPSEGQGQMPMNMGQGQMPMNMGQGQMPMNMGQGQWGQNPMGQGNGYSNPVKNARDTEFKSAFQQKMMERELINYETGQPINSNAGEMGQMGMGQMGMGQMNMGQMPMGQMPMGQMNQMGQMNTNQMNPW